MNKLRAVEEIMSMNSETVRHQPVSSVPTAELLERLERLMICIHDIAFSAGIEIDSANCFAYKNPISQVSSSAALKALSDLEWHTIRTAQTLGLARDLETSFITNHASRVSNLMSASHGSKD